MKVGILTLFFKNNNWGGNLQGYALKTYIAKNYSNISVDLVHYWEGDHGNIIYKSTLDQIRQYPIKDVVKKIIDKIRKPDKSFYITKTKREKLFSEFQEENDTNPFVYMDDTLSKLSEDYDVLIVGSDQVWNPNLAFRGYYLDGVSAKKISYAASIARNSLSSKEAKVMIPLIEKFDYVSVREKTAKRIIEEHCGKTVVEVIDPTMLLTKEEWERVACETLLELPKKYALQFLFTDNTDYRKDIKAYCQKQNIPLVRIPHAAHFVKGDETAYGINCYDIGPKEFIGLIKNASIVFTDSFHGSVFSIIFEKQFLVFERDKNTKTSKNSRLYDLLEKFDLTQCYVKNNIVTTLEAMGKIDYCVIREKMNILRHEAKEFLNKAIEDIEEG